MKNFNTHKFLLFIVPFLSLTAFAQNAVIIEPSLTTIQSIGKNTYFYNGNLGLGSSDFTRAKLTISRVPDGIYGLSVQGSTSNDSKTRVAEFLNTDFLYQVSGSSAQFQFSGHSGQATFEIDVFNYGKKSPGHLSMQANTNGFVGIGTSTPAAKLHVATGDVYIDNIYSGIILRSPNGSCFRVGVDNYGTLSSQYLPCP